MTKGGAALDDPSRTAAVDRSGMLSAVAGLGGQLRRGWDLGRSAACPREWGDPQRHDAIVVAGMGGSGIAGDVVRALLRDHARSCIEVSKGYALPAFSTPETLVFVVSYSGDTEEALAVYEQAQARRCRTVTVSAGGRLRELAEAAHGVHVDLPADAPMPRAALGYLVGGVVGFRGLMEPDPQEVAATARLLDELAARWEAREPMGRNEAKGVAAWLGERTPLVWGSEGLLEPVALRWKNQMNENAKIPAFWSVLPELDHNEVEGWSPDTAKGVAVIALRHPGEHPRVAERFALTIELASSAGLEVREVHAEGSSPLERLFSLVLLGDFVSTYLAILRGVDPTPVPVLTDLKERLRR